MPDDHIKRCDVRVPIKLYNEIEKIAVEEYNAPLYHKTGKPQVSSTIIQLLRLGIENLKGEVSDKESDTLPDKVRELESKIEQIQSASLSDNQPDTIPEIDLDEKIADAIAELKSDGDFLKAIAIEVQKISAAVTDDNCHPTENVLKPAETRVDETTTQVNRASLAPIFEEVEKSESETIQKQSEEKSPKSTVEQNKTRIKLNSVKEAYQLAQSRGFEGKLASFRSNISREKYAQQYQESYGIVKTGQRNESQYFDVLEKK